MSKINSTLKRAFESKMGKSFLDGSALDSAGFLNPSEATPFIELLQVQDNFYDEVNLKIMNEKEMDINTIEYKENIIRPIAAQSSPTLTEKQIPDEDMASPTVNTPKLKTYRVGSKVFLAYDEVHRLSGLTGQSFEDELMDITSKKFAKDVKEHIFNASTSTLNNIAYAGSPVRYFDGITKILETSGQVVDFNDSGFQPIVKLDGTGKKIDDAILWGAVSKVFDYIEKPEEWRLYMPPKGILSEKSKRRLIAENNMDRLSIEEGQSTIHGVPFTAISNMQMYSSAYETVADDAVGNLYSAVLIHPKNIYLGFYDGNMKLSLKWDDDVDGYYLWIKANIGVQIVDPDRGVHLKNIKYEI